MTLVYSTHLVRKKTQSVLHTYIYTSVRKKPLSTIHTFTEETRHCPQYMHLSKKHATAGTMKLRKTYATVHTRYTACVEMVRQSSPVHSKRGRGGGYSRNSAFCKTKGLLPLIEFSLRLINAQWTRGMYITSSRWRTSGPFVSPTEFRQQGRNPPFYP